MIAGFIALGCALVLACVSAYFSVVGLTAIFAATFWPVVIMGAALEAAKLSTASLLYREWARMPVSMRSFLTAAVVVLMAITSMGTFGFLSRAHIEQRSAATTLVGEKVAELDQKISVKKAQLDDLDKRVGQIDSAVDKLTSSGRARVAIVTADEQAKTRSALQSRRETENAELSKLKIERNQLETEVKKVEAEVGPLRYVAELFFGAGTEDQLERAVRFLIVIIVSVFDPLAVLLLIAANMAIKNGVQLQHLGVGFKPGYVEIDEKSIARMDEGGVSKFFSSR